MSKRIWKYNLHPLSSQIMAPRGSRVLCVQAQHGTPRLWVEVYPDEPVEPYPLAVYGTGHEIPDDPGRYIGTFQIDDGAFVFHVYDKKVPQ